MESIEWLLVDGYNLLYGWRKNRCAIEDAREDLLQHLIEYSGYHSLKTIVVFDGQGSLAETDRRAELLSVVYTASFETADQWIEKKTSQLCKEGWRVRVVTSDSAEQQHIFGSGALRVPVREMIFEMTQLAESLKKDKKARKQELVRSEIFGRLDGDIAKKLEKMRFAKKEDSADS